MVRVKNFIRSGRQWLALVAVMAAVCLSNQLLIPPSAAATGKLEPVAAPDFNLLRYDEDYSYLHDPGKRAGLLGSFKYIPLNADGDIFLSLGGEIRERYEYSSNPVWGQDPQDQHGVFLQRYLLHADLHFTEHFRFFGQLKSALASGREGGPSPVDEDQMTVQQAFLDLNGAPWSGTRLALRSGRQEVRFGSGRIVDVREGPNLRRKFDGIRSFFECERWRVDGIAARPVGDEQGIFDDDTNDSQALWGVYAVRKHTLFAKGGIDLYYLGFENDNAVYNQGAGKETRHSIGTRLWGKKINGWDYNCEFLYQWGRFGNGDIMAWTAASEAGFTWHNAPLGPRVALNANIASGDRDPSDPDLQTFNPLYPRGNYFSELGLLGPRNFFNVHPFLTINPLANVSITTDVNFYWRQRLEDGVYSPNGQLLRSSEGSDARFVGSAVSLTTDWRINKYMTATAIHSHFFPGQFIRETGPADSIDFVELTLQLLF